jgi:hypothetical protein
MNVSAAILIFEAKDKEDFKTFQNQKTDRILTAVLFAQLFEPQVDALVKIPQLLLMSLELLQ